MEDVWSSRWSDLLQCEWWTSLPVWQEIDACSSAARLARGSCWGCKVAALACQAAVRVWAKTMLYEPSDGVIPKNYGVVHDLLNLYGRTCRCKKDAVKRLEVTSNIEYTILSSPCDVTFCRLAVSFLQRHVRPYRFSRSCTLSDCSLPPKCYQQICRQNI